VHKIEKKSSPAGVKRPVGGVQEQSRVAVHQKIAGSSLTFQEAATRSPEPFLGRTFPLQPISAITNKPVAALAIKVHEGKMPPDQHQR